MWASTMSERYGLSRRFRTPPVANAVPLTSSWNYTGSAGHDGASRSLGM